MEFELEKDAMAGEPMPSGIDLIDALAYQFFVFLYRRYYSGQISRENAKKEKLKFMHQYRKYKKQWEIGTNLCLYFADLRKRCETAASDYAKNKNIDNANALYEAIYNIKP